MLSLKEAFTDAANAFQSAGLNPSPLVERQWLTYFQLARLGIAGDCEDDRLLADFGASNHAFSGVNRQRVRFAFGKWLAVDGGDAIGAHSRDHS
jgi:hypothetical protein